MAESKTCQLNLQEPDSRLQPLPAHGRECGHYIFVIMFVEPVPRGEFRWEQRSFASTPRRLLILQHLCYFYSYWRRQVAPEDFPEG